MSVEYGPAHGRRDSWLFVRPAPSAFLAAALAAFPVAPAALRAQSLPGESPFAVRSPAPAESQPAGAGYELLGMSVVGKTTILGLSRASDHHSFWIPLGGTAADITAVSYDPRSDQAVIRVSGKTLTLSLRRASVAPAAPSTSPPSGSPSTAAPPVSAVTGPATAPIPSLPPMTKQQEKEMEARMLVTDLLEIGQQQRKAYAEAQKAAAEKASPPKETASKRHP